MRIVFLAPASNYHTKKWCSYFVLKKYDVHVISLTDGLISNVEVHFINSGTDVNASDIKKLGYLLMIKKVRSLVKSIDPDIISVHYATSYGTLAALSGITNYSLSVWGTDIYAFPNKSFFHKLLLKYNLRKAKVLMSTSHAMAKEAKKYTGKSFIITPFGVDMEMFNPAKRTRDDNCFVIGNIKSLSDEYGIDLILEATSIIKKDRPEIPLKVRIAGNGVQEKTYKKLASELNIEKDVIWIGYISQVEAANEWANFDVAVIPSRRESFGVSAVEAQASGIPVVISDVEGLLEATLPGKSSLVVARNDARALAGAIVNLYENRNLRKNMGACGRKFVLDNYEYNNCFKTIEEALRSLL